MELLRPSTYNCVCVGGGEARGSSADGATTGGHPPDGSACKRPPGRGTWWRRGGRGRQGGAPLAFRPAAATPAEDGGSDPYPIHPLGSDPYLVHPLVSLPLQRTAQWLDAQWPGLSPWARRAAESRQARPGEAHAPSWGTA